LYLDHLARIARYEEDQKTERTRLNTQARERIALAEGNAVQYGFNEAPQADAFSAESIMQLLSNPAVSQVVSQFLNKGKGGEPPTGGMFPAPPGQSESTSA
jgi:hypothetical protein